MKTYTGDRTIDGIRVLVDAEPLDPRIDLRRLSDTGFEWTYEGGAPAQLALALLADHFQDDDKALAHYRDIFASRRWVVASDSCERPRPRGPRAPEPTDPRCPR